MLRHISTTVTHRLKKQNLWKWAFPLRSFRSCFSSGVQDSHISSRHPEELKFKGSSSRRDHEDKEDRSKLKRMERSSAIATEAEKLEGIPAREG
jgi:hypothetical protein